MFAVIILIYYFLPIGNFISILPLQHREISNHVAVTNFEREREREREREFRIQTGLFVDRLHALYKWVVGERGFRTVKIRLSWQLHVLATKNVFEKN